MCPAERCLMIAGSLVTYPNEAVIYDASRRTKLPSIRIAYETNCAR
jgi:hypothetical protein